MQRLQGDGMAFVHACGTIIKRELRGERIRLDTGCLVAYTEGISFDVMLVPGLKSMIFGKYGCIFFLLPLYFLFRSNTDLSVPCLINLRGCRALNNLRWRRFVLGNITRNWYGMDAITPLFENGGSNYSECAFRGRSPS